jgi:hypothetical protein
MFYDEYGIVKVIIHHYEKFADDSYFDYYKVEYPNGQRNFIEIEDIERKATKKEIEDYEYRKVVNNYNI